MFTTGYPHLEENPPKPENLFLTPINTIGYSLTYGQKCVIL